MKKPYGFVQMFTTVIFIASLMAMMIGLTMFITNDPKIATSYFLVGAIVGIISGACLENLCADEEGGRLPKNKDCGDDKKG